MFDGGRPRASLRWLLIGALHRDQQQPQVADLGKQTVKGRLIGNLTGDDSHAVGFRRDTHAVKPGGPTLVEAVLDSNLVVHNSSRPRDAASVVTCECRPGWTPRRPPAVTWYPKVVRIASPPGELAQGDGRDGQRDRTDEGGEHDRVAGETGRLSEPGGEYEDVLRRGQPGHHHRREQQDAVKPQ